jgi:carboxymethylenebutenolidase
MCHEYGAHPPIPPISGAAMQAEDIVLTAQDGARFSAYLAQPPQPTGAQVLIFPDVRGLHPFYKELAQRFAEIGVCALAIDYFGRTAGTEARDETFVFQPHVEKMQMPTFLLDVSAALAFMRAKPGSEAPFVVAFCRGGTLALLTGAENFDLSGLIVFYGGLSRPVAGSKGPTLEQAAKIHHPVLGLYGGADQGIPPEAVKQLDQQLDQAGVPHELIVYPGATHSFFDRRYSEFAEASADAWKRVQAFIAETRAARRKSREGQN